MENKSELIEKLAAIETDIYNDKVDLKSISLKLDAAYKYEDELEKRRGLAKQSTAELRQQFFTKSTEIAQKYDKMKNVLEIFTGNFYNHSA